MEHTRINLKLMPILLMAIVSMIVVIQFPTALAGACVDDDEDDYYANKHCHHALDPDDGDPCNPDPSSRSCSPVAAIENLVDDVEYLIEYGELEINDGQINSILGKLEKAVDKVESDNTNGAIGSLNAFINQVNAFINAGSISPDDGQALIFGAQSIIAAM